jgi:hypothetical protein
VVLKSDNLEEDDIEFGEEENIMTQENLVLN